MLTVICWKWKRAGHRTSFTAGHVNALKRAVAAHLDLDHEFACITDDPRGLDDDIRVIPLWRELWSLGKCYVRLKAFAPEAATLIGPRFVSIDLDCVITGDLTPLFNRAEDFVIAGISQAQTLYNGSMWLLTAGSRPQVWHDFDPKRSPKETKAAGLTGSDQAWLAYRLGHQEATWGPADGVYGYRGQVRDSGLPDNARIVFFQGKQDPWDRATRAESPWIERYLPAG